MREILGISGTAHCVHIRRRPCAVCIEEKELVSGRVRDVYTPILCDVCHVENGGAGGCRVGWKSKQSGGVNTRDRRALFQHRNRFVRRDVDKRLRGIPEITSRIAAIVKVTAL